MTNSYSASSWEDYTNGKPNATVHSHPGIKAAVDEETFSMGYGAPYRDTDWNNVRIDVKQAREKARKSYVYFPNSGRLYNVGYHNAIYIKDIKNYRGFYFGTINKK